MKALHASFACRRRQQATFARITALSLFLCFLFCSINAFSLFTDYSKLTPSELIQMLEKKQIDNPQNPIINYNLGTAYCKVKNFTQAASSFNRAFSHAQPTDPIRNRSIFNLATTLTQKSTASLPQNWERPDVKIEDAVLDAAIKDCQEAIASYEKLLLLDPADTKGQTNKKYTQELLKKLQAKKQQQQAQKNDQQQKDKDKDNKQQNQGKGKQSGQDKQQSKDQEN